MVLGREKMVEFIVYLPPPPRYLCQVQGQATSLGSPKPQPLSRGALGLLTYDMKAAIVVNIKGFSVFHPWELFTSSGCTLPDS